MSIDNQNDIEQQSNPKDRKGDESLDKMMREEEEMYRQIDNK